ncbi:MAG TPA: lysophospholipid acyltransferase family protein [Rhizomicrobium sp.]|nr:lysophospholipid acyltransferase family protein [Rhizomicrobium sp.]
MTVLRSALFLLWFLAVTTLLSLVFLPVLVLPRGATIWLARLWSRATFWGLKLFAGIDWEIRGTPPRGPVLVASKHMSMWDTLALYLALDAPAIVLKRELLRIPFYGWFLWKATAIAIDRKAGARSLRKMATAAEAVLAEGRPILIFPEGTRKKPGEAPDYKPGVAGLYGMLDVPCVPVALNSGLYWTGFLKRPGTIVLEFLEPIAPGLKRGAFMSLLEQRIESATAAL